MKSPAPLAPFASAPRSEVSTPLVRPWPVHKPHPAAPMPGPDMCNLRAFPRAHSAPAVLKTPSFAAAPPSSPSNNSDVQIVSVSGPFFEEEQSTATPTPPSPPLPRPTPATLFPSHSLVELEAEEDLGTPLSKTSSEKSWVRRIRRRLF